MTSHKPSEPIRRRLLSSLTLLALTAACAGAGVWGAFAATTSNAGNEIVTGTVALADNDAGSVLYSVNNAAPGTSVTRCLRVTYTGSLDSEVRLYTPSAIGALGPHIDFEVQPGSQAAATFPDCSGFVADGAPLFSGTLADFASAHGGWAGGLVDAPGAGPGWSASDSVVYRIRATVADDQAAAGLSTDSHALVWEARNR